MEQTKDAIEGSIEEALKASSAATDSILDMPMVKVRLATLQYCHEPGLFHSTTAYEPEQNLLAIV